MNRVFKTKWSVAHQEYVVTDEKHTTKTKSTKSAVALAVAAMMFAAGTASASFVDTSFVADNPFVFQQAKKSFETAEYQKNWGLSAMKASSAYAAWLSWPGRQGRHDGLRLPDDASGTFR